MGYKIRWLDVMWESVRWTGYEGDTFDTLDTLDTDFKDPI